MENSLISMENSLISMENPLISMENPLISMENEDSATEGLKISQYPDALIGETVWFDQSQYEAMETKYQMALAGLQSGIEPIEQVCLIKRTGPQPVNYKQNLEIVIAELEAKHSNLTEHVKDLKKHRQTRINHLHESIVTLSYLVQTRVNSLGSEVNRCDFHIASIQNLLASLKSTIKTVKDESEMIKNKNRNSQTKGKPAKPQTHKALCSSLKSIDNDLRSFFHEASKLKIGQLQTLSNIIKNVNKLKFVENIDVMDGFIKRYPKVQSKLQKLSETLTAKEVSDIVVTLANGVQADDNDRVGNCQIDANSTLKKEKTKSANVNVSDGRKDNNCHDHLYGVKNAECYSESDVNGAESNVFQRSEDSMMFHSHSDKKINPQDKKVPKRENTPKESQARSIEDNSHLKGNRFQQGQGNKKTTSSQPKGAYHRLETGATKVNKERQEKALPSDSDHPFTEEYDSSLLGNPMSLAQGNTNFFQQNPEVNGGPGKTYQDYNEYKQQVQSQLSETAQKIRHMCLVSGPSLDLQEMLTEAELLLQMIQHNLMQEQFPHRFALLMMAFNFHQELHGKMDKAEAAPGSYPFRKSKDITANPSASRVRGTTVNPAGTVAGSSSSNKPKGASASLFQEKQTKMDGKRNRHKKDTTVYLAGENATPEQSVKLRKIFPCASSLVQKIATLNPSGVRDKHRAGVSSVAILDDLNLLVLVDIINSSLKLYDTSRILTDGKGTYVSSLVVQQPYYMTAFAGNKVLVSRAERVLSVIQVADENNPLEVCEHIHCPNQYYGMGWVKDDVVACACYERNTVDLIRVGKHRIDILSTLTSECFGPELLAVIPHSQIIVYLERVPGQCMFLSGVDRKKKRLFHVSLGGKDSDVWNLACVEQKIVCCSKQTNKVLLFSQIGRRIASLTMPLGTVTMPFAIGFSKYGHLYMANDAAWEEDNNHYVTTEINVFAFSNS